MKKLLSLLLAAVLVLTSISVVTFADATPTVTIAADGNGEVKQGQNIDVYFTLSDAPDIKSASLNTFVYDDTALQMVGSTILGPLAGASVKNEPVGGAMAGLMVAALGANTNCNGQILKLTFKALESAELGTYEISCTAQLKNLVEGKEEDVAGTTLVPGSIKIVADPFPDTIKLENKTVTYNDEAQTIAVAGLEGDFAGIEPDYTYKNGDEVLASAPSTVGTYTVIAHIEKAGYTPKDLTATLTIEPKEVEIDGLTAVNKTYDKMVEVDLEGGELVGKIGNDEVTANIPTVGTVADANAGTAKAVTFTTIELTGADATNYVLAGQPTVTVDIEKRVIVLKAPTLTATIGTENEVVMANVLNGLALKDGSTLAEGDTLRTILANDSLDVLEFVNTNAEGEYVITKNADFALTTDAAANYDWTFEDGLLTVQDKLGVNVTVSMEGWTYGGDASPLTYEQTDAGNGTVEGEPSILFTGTTAAGDAYSSTDKPSAAGSYRVTVTYEDANLYGSDYADFVIAKADKDMTAVSVTPVTFNYTDADKEVTVDNLPADVTVKAISYKLGEAEAVATPVEVGTYAAIVSFDTSDANYNVPADKTFADVLTINAEKPSNVVVSAAGKSESIIVTVTADANGSAITSVAVTVDGTTQEATLSGNAYTTTFTGLTNGTEYTASVVVANGVGSADAVEAKATPKKSSSTSIPSGSKLPASTPSIVGPSTDDPSTDEPSTDEPGTDEPGTEEPGTEEPEIEIVVDPDEEVALIAPEAEIEKDAETGAIVWENTYDDVDADAWYADAVGFAKVTGLMNGVGETAFAPEDTLTRGMFATILYRLVDAPEAAQKVGFKDVADDAWYADAVNWGVKNGIVNGVGGASFAPENDVTREQMATMLYRFAQLLGYTAEGAELAFDDAADVADYATEAFAWCTANGIINGVSDTELAPQDTATRAQAAAVFMRALEFFNK